MGTATCRRDDSVSTIRIRHIEKYIKLISDSCLLDIECLEVCDDTKARLLQLRKDNNHLDFIYEFIFYSN